MERSSEKFKIFLRDYWRYYRELEDEFLQTQKFVDFRQSNFGTYSAEYLKLFQAVCSEIDVIGKAMAAEVNSSFKPEDKKNNILKWWYQIQDKYTILEDYLKLDIPGMKLTEKTVSLLDDIPCIPWKGFRVEEYRDTKGSKRLRTVGGSPAWWQDYNNVKHARMFLGREESNYIKANLGNVSRAFAALYILEQAFMDAIGTKKDLQAFADHSRLFHKVEYLTGISRVRPQRGQTTVNF